MERRRRTRRKRTTTERRQRLVLAALHQLGKPYWGYGDPPSRAPREFDCSSFTQYVYGCIGVRLPRRAIKQAACGRTIQMRSEADLAVGDLLFFRGVCGNYSPRFPNGIGHAMMYIGRGKIIHAKWNGRDGGRVRSASLQRWLTRDKLIIVKRMLS